MSLSEEERKNILGMSYYDMLKKWRFCPIGSDYFEGERGTFFRRTMEEKKLELSVDEAVRISKKVGWDK